MSSGKLFVVGTPIGNLGDFSPRAVETLKEVDFIAAEDTRKSGLLLSRIGIKAPLVSYYDHNKDYNIDQQDFKESRLFSIVIQL